MTYYVISKIELEGEENLKYTDVGYAENIDIVNIINEDYDSTLGAFIGENRTKLQLGEINFIPFYHYRGVGVYISGSGYIYRVFHELCTVFMDQYLGRFL